MRRKQHISSAIVSTRQEHTDQVASALSAFENVEVHATAPGKIVVVIEGDTPGVLGGILIEISALDQVVGAYMVFEQAIEEADSEQFDAT